MNVYGVIKFLKQPYKSRGSDYCMLVSLVDDSFTDPDESLKCLLFAKQEDLLPVGELGDIIRFHRLTINTFRGSVQGQSSPGYSWLMWSGDTGASLDPQKFSSTHFQVTEEDKERVRQLRQWSTGKQSLVENLSTFNQVGVNCYFDLVCQVVSVAVLEPGVCTLLRVWDGTTSIYKVKTVEKTFETDEVATDLILEEISEGMMYDVFIYDNHTQAASKIKPGDFVKFMNLHASEFKNKDDQIDNQLNIQLPMVEFVLHRGDSYGRGIRVLSPDNPALKQTKERLEKLSAPSLSLDAEYMNSDVDRDKEHRAGTSNWTNKTSDKEAKKDDNSEKSSRPENTTKKSSRSEDITEKSSRSEDITEKSSRSEDTREKSSRSEDTREKSSRSEDTREKSSRSEDTREKSSRSDDIAEKASRSENIAKTVMSNDLTDNPRSNFESESVGDIRDNIRGKRKDRSDSNNAVVKKRSRKVEGLDKINSLEWEMGEEEPGMSGTSESNPRCMLETKTVILNHPHIKKSKLRDVLAHNGPGKFRVCAQVLAYHPTLITVNTFLKLYCKVCKYVCELPEKNGNSQRTENNLEVGSTFREIPHYMCPQCLSHQPLQTLDSPPHLSFIYMMRMVLRDKTGMLMANLWKSDATEFFKGLEPENIINSASQLRKLRGILSDLCPTDESREKPWVECCLRTYTVNGQTHYQIFDTAVV